MKFLHLRFKQYAKQDTMTVVSQKVMLIFVHSVYNINHSDKLCIYSNLNLFKILLWHFVFFTSI